MYGPTISLRNPPNFIIFCFYIFITYSYIEFGWALPRKTLCPSLPDSSPNCAFFSDLRTPWSIISLAKGFFGRLKISSLDISSWTAHPKFFTLSISYLQIQPFIFILFMSSLLFIGWKMQGYNSKYFNWGWNDILLKWVENVKGRISRNNKAWKEMTEM